MKNLPQLDRRTLIATGAATAAAGLGLAAPANAIPRYELIGQHMPAIDLPLVGGGRLNAASFAGKTTILNFWGLWCPDCMAEINEVAKLPGLLARERNIAFQSVHMTTRFGRYSGVEQFWELTNIRFPVAIDANRSSDASWHINWVPTFVIIDRAGVIRDACYDLNKDGAPNAEGLVRRARAVARRR